MLIISDWEIASLPGGFAPSFRASTQQSLDRNIVYNEPGINRPLHLQSENQVRPRAQHNVPEGYRTSIQTIPGVAHRMSGIHNRREASVRKPIDPPPSYIKFQSGVPFDAQHQLSVPWFTLLRSMPRDRHKMPSAIARDRLDEICFKTEAFIATPRDEEARISVWGTPEQVDSALKELESFEMYIRQMGIRPSQANWHKGRAFDGRVESRREEDEREREMAEGLRILSDETEYDHEMWLIWPDEIDIDKFIDQHDSTTLRDIRGKTLCKVEFIPTGLKYVKVYATTSEDASEVFGRIRNLVKEDIAQMGRFIIANRFRLPRSSMYRAKVGLDKDPKTNYYLATLHGDPLPKDELDSWSKLCLSEDDKNCEIISNAIETSLKSLQASQRHVRMRATFGELGFSQLELPPDGQEDYTFDDFCAMMVKRRTTMQSMGLRAPGKSTADLVDILSRHEQFSELETRYTLHFDFEGRNNSILRLDQELRYPTGSDEITVFSSRWLEFGAISDSEILEVSMLDFEHPQANFQLHVGATKLFTKSQSELHSFTSRISFDAPKNGLKAGPRRRTRFPPGRQDLRQVEEISIARFRYKAGNGYLEIQRKDIYPQSDQMRAFPIRSDWSAKYYYPEWDNILGQFASLEPGQDITWPRKLSTLFGDARNPMDCKLKGVPAGFKSFIEEVLEISAFLHDGMQALPNVEADERNGNGLEYYRSLMD